MIDEAVLERLLRDEAETYSPPAGGPARIQAAAAQQGGGVHRPRRPWLTVAAAAAMLVVGVGVAGRGGGLGMPASLSGSSAERGTNTAYDGAGGAVGGKNAAPDQPADPAIVRTGEIGVAVPKGKVAETLRAATRVAAAHGGFVAESSSATAGEHPYGTVTIRVPVAAYDQAVEDVGRLGEVRHSDTRTEDVSEQVTDTAARLRSLTATRDQLRTLLGRAKDVGEVLAVQQRLTEVQTDIERLQAERDALRDKTTYGTLLVSVGPPESAAERGGFSEAWHDAVDGFVGGFEALVAASGVLAFLLLVGGVLLVAGRRAYRYWVRGVV